MTTPERWAEIQAAIEDLEVALALPEQTLRLIVEQVVERLKEET